ncbi:carbohydrate kinase [Nocardioides anomalus]|uniref:Carbohydrate kinase n=1 Tax=Nocardioides anomalus TaxID=2712223 RepID=A0A6G6WK13_9ACTN|nr:carbohydrate kinase family protein [Nocardioides anomalus]QIG45497.1 carbohydrate kinase [Nocardioides anomalus]
MAEPLVVVVGGANVDVKARTTAPLVDATSNPGVVLRSPGGVGRNVAENLARLGSRVALVSTVGNDPDGDWLLAQTAAAGVDVAPVLRGGATGRYVAVLDHTGDLAVGVSDMAATDSLGPDALDHDLLRAADLVVLDGNLPATTIDAALDVADRVVVDPVSVAKAARIAPLFRPERPVFAVTPNAHELRALGSVAALHGHGVEVVWVRRGAEGSELHPASSGPVWLAAPVVDPVDVTGAGDALLAAFCHALLRGVSLEDAAAYGHRAAALTVADPHTVVPDLSARMAR